MDFKDQLIKLGSENPGLRNHLEKVINYIISKEARSRSDVKPGDKVQVGREVAVVKDIDELEMYPVEVEFSDGFTGRYDFDDVDLIR